MLRWQGKQHTVAILVSFTELPSTLELSRFGDDDRRTSFAAVPWPVDGWLDYFRVPASWRHMPGWPRSGAKLGTRPQYLVYQESTAPSSKGSSRSYEENPSRRL